MNTNQFKSAVIKALEIKDLEVEQGIVLLIQNGGHSLEMFQVGDTSPGMVNLFNEIALLLMENHRVIDSGVIIKEKNSD